MPKSLLDMFGSSREADDADVAGGRAVALRSAPESAEDDESVERLICRLVSRRVPELDEGEVNKLDSRDRLKDYDSDRDADDELDDEVGVQEENVAALGQEIRGEGEEETDHVTDALMEAIGGTVRVASDLLNQEALRTFQLPSRHLTLRQTARNSQNSSRRECIQQMRRGQRLGLLCLCFSYFSRRRYG